MSNLTTGGAAVDPAASYRIAVNSFLADGGDNFTVEGTDRLGGEVDTVPWRPTSRRRLRARRWRLPRSAGST